MAKNIFRAQEITQLTKKISLDAPFTEEPETVVPEQAEEYTGPTADDLRREAELFKQNWEKEREAMIAAAKAEAEGIVKEAENTAFTQVKEQTDEAQRIKQQAEDEAAALRSGAQQDAAAQVEEAQAKVDKIRNEAFEEGYQKGREEGFESGRQEAQRLIEHLHTIITSAIEKRNEIIDQSETQLINLVLLISQKVIKVISENQKNVVINNVIQALRKLKSRGDVVIRVNLTDVQLTSDHVQDFMRMVENVRSITVLEDSSVDKGGCIIETDFGQIDARISSQFKEIEENIMKLAPIKVKGESDEDV